MDKFDTLQKTSHLNHASIDQDPSLLVFILDTNPYSWSEISASTSLQSALSDIIVFLNAHCALNQSNQACVIASHVESAKFLFPTPENGDRVIDPRREANGFRPFIIMQDQVTRNLKALIEGTTEDSITSTTSMMAGAIALALAYINRQRITLTETVHLRSRIMVLSVSTALSISYIPMMNAIFSAQKMGVAIDILKLGGDQVFLQQASDATQGMYYNIDASGSILQTLMLLFLPDLEVRKCLNLPIPKNVDFRAACFCHKKVLDIGFVCSVCLSIFCQPFPKCITCDTEFDLQELQKLGAKPVVVYKRKKAIQREDSIMID